MSQPPPPPPAAPPPPPPPASGYPVTIDFTGPNEVKRWSPLINWLLAIPHIIVLYGLLIVLFFLQFISFFTVLFTKNIPDSLFDFQVMVYRYQWRVATYTIFLRSDYPPFEFDTVRTDPGTDPARLSMVKPAEYHRWLPLVKWLLAIPHYFVLVFLAIAVLFVWIVAFFAVLFTGKWPDGLRAFVIGYYRWNERVTAYTGLLIDEYPLFSLD